MSHDESLIPTDWFKKADSDLRASDILMREGSELGVAALLLQQAAEKYLKGYLLSRGWRLRRIHNLATLLNDVIVYNPDFERFRAVCQDVTQYYAQQRYPFMFTMVVSIESLESARAILQELFEKIRSEVR